MVAETALLLRRRRRALFLSDAAASRLGGGQQHYHHYHQHHHRGDDILNSTTSNGSAETELEVRMKNLTVDIVDDGMSRDYSYHSYNGRDLYVRGNGSSSTATTPAASSSSAAPPAAAIPGRRFYDETPRAGNGSAQEAANRKQAQEEYYRRQRQQWNTFEQRQDQDLESGPQQQQNPQSQLQSQSQSHYQNQEQRDQEKQYELFLQSVQFIKQFMEYHSIPAPGISKSSSTISSSSSSSSTTASDDGSFDRPESLTEFVRRCRQGLAGHYNNDQSLLAMTQSDGSKSEDDSLEREMSQLHDISNELSKELEAITLDVTPQCVVSSEGVSNNNTNNTNNNGDDASRSFSSRPSLSSESNRGYRPMSRIHERYRQYSQKLARSKELNATQQQQQQQQPPQSKETKPSKRQSGKVINDSHHVQSDKTVTTVPLFKPQKIKIGDQPTKPKLTNNEHCDTPAESDLTLGLTATLSSLSWVDSNSSNHSRSSHLVDRTEFNENEGNDQSQNKNHDSFVDESQQNHTRSPAMPKESFSITDLEPKNTNIIQSDQSFSLAQSTASFDCTFVSADQNNNCLSTMDEKPALYTIKQNQEKDDTFMSDQFMVSQDDEKKNVLEEDTDQRPSEIHFEGREPSRQMNNQQLTPDTTITIESSTTPNVKRPDRTLRIPETVKARHSIRRRCNKVTPEDQAKLSPKDARLAKVLSESLQRFRNDRCKAEANEENVDNDTLSHPSMPFDESDMDLDSNFIDEKSSFLSIADDGDITEGKLMQDLSMVKDDVDMGNKDALMEQFDMTNVLANRTVESKTFDYIFRQLPKTWSLSPVVSGFTDSSAGSKEMDVDEGSSDSGVSSFFSVDETPQLMEETSKVMTKMESKGQSTIQKMSQNDIEECAENNVLKSIRTNHQQKHQPLYKPTNPPQGTPQILLKYWDMVGECEEKNDQQTPEDIEWNSLQRSPLNDLVIDHSLLDEISDECSEDRADSLLGDNRSSILSPSVVLDGHHDEFSSTAGLPYSSVVFPESVEINGRQVESLRESERAERTEFRVKNDGASCNDSAAHTLSDRHENQSFAAEVGHGIDAVELVIGSSQPLESTNKTKSEPSAVSWMKIYSEMELETTEEEPTISPIIQPASKYYSKKRSTNYPPPLAEDRHPMSDRKRNQSNRNKFENDVFPETRRPTKRVKTDDVSITGLLCTAASVFVDWTETTTKNFKLPDCGGKSYVRCTKNKRSSTRTTTSRKKSTTRTTKTWREAIPLDWKDLNRAYERRPVKG